MNYEVIERLKSLENSAGILTPDAVLHDARNIDSPLHSYFDWDDKTAAHKFRLDQARKLIRSVRLVVNEQKHQINVIGYVKNPDNQNEQGYVNTVSLRSDKEKARDVLTREINLALSAMQRAHDVAHAVGLKNEVYELIAKIEHVKNAV